MEINWYRRRATEIGRSARAAATERKRKALENEQRNWLLIADRIDEHQATLAGKPIR